MVKMTRCQSYTDCKRPPSSTGVQKPQHRGALLRWFMALYEEDVVQEEVVIRWRDEVNPIYEGKGEAFIQVNRWLEWLQQEETSEEE